MIPILLFSAPSGFGKSHFISSLIPYFLEKNLKIGFIKHHHASFYPAGNEKDTGKMLKAGAQKALLIADDIVIVEEPRMFQVEAISSFADTYFRGYDLVLVEGFKENKTLPKVLLIRGKSERAQRWFETLKSDPNIIALITDANWSVPYPCFRPAEKKRFADYVTQKLGIGGSTER